MDIGVCCTRMCFASVGSAVVTGVSLGGAVRVGGMRLDA